MKSRIAPVFVVAATLWAGAVHAASFDNRETVTLDRAAIVGSTVLPAGSYRIELQANPDTVKFLKRGRTVAEAPCKVGLAQVTYPGNALHFRTGGEGPDRLIKIVFVGSKLAIELQVPEDVETVGPVVQSANRP